MANKKTPPPESFFNKAVADLQQQFYKKYNSKSGIFL